MSAGCSLCGGACAGADLGPLLDARLGWLWDQIARTADRRGDARLVDGTLSLRAPTGSEERSAATGLVGGRALKRGQTRTVSLSQLTSKLRVRGPSLTPAAVAAHALGRPLAVRASEEARRRAQDHELMTVFVEAARNAPTAELHDLEAIWAALRRSGWVSRFASVEDPKRLLQSAIAVVSCLPAEGTRTDRRRLAAEVAGNAHALDYGSPLAGAVLAILSAAGRVTARQKPRAAWASVNVDCDDVVGGLAAVGVWPVGWSLPPGAIVTLPPRILKACEWPSPEDPGSWIFVTENPSVAAAAAELAGAGVDVRLLCTSGTPSADEIAAIARLANAGWCLAVRADFDAAGLAHLAAILDKATGAVPWRMAAGDYIESLRGAVSADAKLDRIPATPWDPQLAAAMRAKGVPGHEESLLEALLDDLRRGTPPRTQEFRPAVAGDL